MEKNKFLHKDELFHLLKKDTKKTQSYELEYNKSGRFFCILDLFMKDKVAVYGIFSILILGFGAICIPFFSSYNYYKNHLDMVNFPPSSQFLFGTDELGRDIFVRIWYGARVSIGVGLGGAIIDFFLGSLVGGCSGYVGGKTDEIIMRFVDVIDSVPNMIKAMALMTFIQGSFFSVMFVVAINGWINTARIVRGQVIIMKKRDFFIAAKAIGASHKRILIRHIFPNIMGPVLVSVSMSIPFAIFTESFLSFLGLGIELPFPSWGRMVSDGIVAMRYYPWRIFFPSFFIFITILSFNCVGHGLRNGIDAKIRARSF